MYLYVLDWAVDRFIKTSQALSNDQPREYFENLLYRSRIKLQFIREEPKVYGFLYKAFLEIPDELKEDMNLRFAAYAKAGQDVTLDSIDRSKFRDDVDVESAVKMVHLLLEGILNRYTPLLSQIEPDEGLKMVEQFEVECLEYFEMIKKGIYR
jgi:TetR/AcrR family transcriptional regulator